MTTYIQIRNLAPLFLAVLLCGCPVKEEIVLPGDIAGYVQDAVTGESVQNAEVQLFYTNDLIDADTTGTDGTFLFNNLEPASYSIEVGKDMYDIHYENITVSSAITYNLNIKLQGEPDPEFSTTMLHYGMEKTQMSFTITNAGGGILSYEIIPSQDWISLSQESGDITQEPDLIEVTIHKDQNENLQDRSHKAWIAIHSQLIEGVQVDSIDLYLNYVMDRDSILYRTTRIGDQIWMAENLNTGSMVHSSGEDFPTKDNGVIEKLCYDNVPLNCDIFGGLYMWEEAMDYSEADNDGIRTTRGICPDGWHLPTVQEWEELHNYLGEDLAGGMLKDTSDLWWQPNVGATNSSGFAALPAGKFESYIGVDTFRREGEKAYFWTTYFDDTDQWKVYTLYRYYITLNMDPVSHRQSYPNAMSVRCVKDP